MSMTTTKQIAEGDRIYATETIIYDTPDFGGTVQGLPVGSEGTVTELTGHDDYDLYIEWDLGFCGTADSGSVALVDPPNSRPMEDSYVIFPTEA